MQFFSFGPRPGSLILQRSVCSLGVLLLVFTASSFPSWALTAPDPQATGEQLETLAREVTFGWAKSHPLVATYLGLSDEDGQLITPSQAENERDLATIRGWEKELASIPLGGASQVELDDAKLLRAQLVSYERQYLVYKTYEKDPSGPSMMIVNAIYL